MPEASIIYHSSKYMGKYFKLLTDLRLEHS